MTETDSKKTVYELVCDGITTMNRWVSGRTHRAPRVTRWGQIAAHDESDERISTVGDC